MTTRFRGSQWYKDAIIYALDVGTFMDADGDGVGDFPGLTSRLDYLASLGVTCLWLLPFYPTPNRDNGYDITDYFGVDPRLGSLGDVVECFEEADRRGMRVVVDLVVNHTSDQHPWFQRARRDPTSPYRDFYVWSDEPTPAPPDSVIFPGVETSPWEYDEVAGAYYWHRFYAHEPDLNVANPRVQEEIRKIIGCWTALGCAGFRLDAASHVVEPKGAVPGVGHRLLKTLRGFLSSRRGDAIFIAEADTRPEELADFFGGNGSCDEMHLLFNFYVNNFLWLALARGSAAPLRAALDRLPEIPEGGQWANFVRNLDELDLEQLSDDERAEVYRVFAPDERMRVYGRGIRRRAAPMLEDVRRLRLAHSLNLTLPGTPVIIYGDEIGMGDDLSQAERASVRLAMQWTSERNGGFSTAPPGRLTAPAIADGPFGYRRVNVADQRREPSSLLRWLERAFWTRRQTPELGRGVCTVLETDRESVFAHRMEWEGGAVVALHNLSPEACEVRLDLGRVEPAGLVDLLEDQGGAEIDRRVARVWLDGYGLRWLRAGGGM